MNPRIIERLISIEFEKTGRLSKRCRANPWNIHQLLPVCKRSLFITVLDHSSRQQLIETRNVSQQRRTCSINIDTNIIDAGLNDLIESLLQLLDVQVVLIHADPDMLRLDFDEFAEGVL